MDYAVNGYCKSAQRRSLRTWSVSERGWTLGFEVQQSIEENLLIHSEVEHG